MQFLIDIGLSLVYFCIFLLLCAWSWRFWKMYVNQKYTASIKWSLLEVKLPREIMKSPLATEIAISGFLQSSGASTWYARNFQGKLPSYGSLEIASIEGVIHFYVRVQSKYKTLMETNFYAQYPGIEIVDADDYTKKIRYHHLTKETSAWGLNMKTGKSWKPTNEETGEKYKYKGEEYSMRSDFLPIKTYVDYGLDKDPKEEFKVDPITPLLETMGTLGKGEHMWYQILIQDESVYKSDGKKMPKFYVNKVTHEHLSLLEISTLRKKQIRTASWNIKDTVVANEFGVPTIIDSFDKEYNQQFREETDKEGKVIKIPIKVLAKHKDTKAVSKKEMELTQDEKDELEAINKKLSKPLAVAVVRLVYVAKKENFNPGHIGTTMSFMKGFTGLNNFIPHRVTDPYDYPWENFMNRRVPWRTEETFEEYVEREGFYPHIPGRSSLDNWEDTFFWTSSMKSRKLFRLIYEAIFYPFDHPEAEDAFILNLEEVATLWHLPGAVAGTPMIPRIDSNKGVAPMNLPL